jgi:U3 small nucleolar RNA-associated protein 25
LKQELSKLFVTVSEYSRTTEIGRGRARFLQGRKPLMLYTGRSHFFHRHAMKGVKNLIFLGLPEHPEFFSDYVNLITAVSGNNNDDDRMLLDDGNNNNNNNNHNKDTSCIALFTKYEAHALERVVGSNNCNRMMRSNNTAFMFYS